MDLDTVRKWRSRLGPVIGVVVLGVFLYWLITYRWVILETFRSIGITRLFFLILLLLASIVLTVFTLVVLVRGKGYDSFRFRDAYHALNLSQLASMIPGGIWGFAGFAAYLWTRGVSKVDSVIIIFLNTLVMLTACVIVGLSGLLSILNPVYVLVCLFPFLFVLFGRNWLDAVRKQYFPESSSIPSTSTLLKTLLLGVVVWTLSSFGFAGFVLAGSKTVSVSPWVISGAYAAGYLGGYLAIFVPSGLGISEGIVTLILGPAIGAEKVLAAAISFRIVHTLVIWCNICVSVIHTSMATRKPMKD